MQPAPIGQDRLGRSHKGGLGIVGGLNLGGSVELVHNPVEVMNLAMEKGAAMALFPVSCRQALVDLAMRALNRSATSMLPML